MADLLTWSTGMHRLFIFRLLSWRQQATALSSQQWTVFQPLHIDESQPNGFKMSDATRQVYYVPSNHHSPRLLQD